MTPITILNSTQIDLTLKRLARQLIENHNDFSNTAILGLQPRGIYFAKRIVDICSEITGRKIELGSLDITFHRDDFRRRDSPLQPNKTEIDFLIEGKDVVLVDDVLYTGRSVRAGLDAMLGFGRPKSVELMCLIDRRFHRDLPIQPNYVGRQIDSIVEERVSVEWKGTEQEDQVVLYIPNKSA
ncbi:bifunctional pyr operon transcriptional regulator/uracil phosphoribosyltransferase PyrR [Luteibaculum oceani]|uniref:Bifunctional protein PyrR n=1 Tax=Luteibaculum oceani TaxID=1294296 RepID=A0A5C6UY25_9FLAO|nr:bifunctional pyr operon transcriptional regulator/uracil phosphoribosyltransferase PyrR [Luteibaculum oceani]TXC76956.1 bifunctional pyr operon transcriptional regulator/uracil phosphoribosyltransferase PyrR [Luteibaculum oceani]